MSELPLTFQTKSQLLSGASVSTDNAQIEPSTCIDAEPYALQVLDDSMAPEFWSGCIILIDPTGRATHGSYVLAKTDSNKIDSEDGEYVFRQLQKITNDVWVLAALNPALPSMEIDQNLSDVVGVIVQRAGKRRAQHKRYD